MVAEAARDAERIGLIRKAGSVLAAESREQAQQSVSVLLNTRLSSHRREGGGGGGGGGGEPTV